jgi:hypothetical protein
MHPCLDRDGLVVIGRLFARDEIDELFYDG